MFTKSKYFQFDKEVGFSLIELLVVIAIIGILGAIVILAINPVQIMQETRDKRRVADLKVLQSALTLYLEENEQYPGETYCDSSIGTQTSACPTNPPQSDWNYSSTFVSQLIVSEHIEKMPVDPLNDMTYYYYYEPTGTTNPVCDGISTTNPCYMYSLGCNFETDSQGFVWVYRDIQY